MLLNLTINVALGFGLVCMMIGFLLFVVAMLYLAFVGFHVVVRTEMTPKVVRRMGVAEMRTPHEQAFADVLADIEASEKAGVLGWQKAGKA